MITIPTHSMIPLVDFLRELRRVEVGACVCGVFFQLTHPTAPLLFGCYPAATCNWVIDSLPSVTASSARTESCSVHDARKQLRTHLYLVNLEEISVAFFLPACGGREWNTDLERRQEVILVEHFLDPVCRSSAWSTGTHRESESSWAGLMRFSGAKCRVPGPSGKNKCSKPTLVVFVWSIGPRAARLETSAKPAFSRNQGCRLDVHFRLRIRTCAHKHKHTCHVGLYACGC